MDKLRGYGKEVWMIGPRADQAKRLLARCCDLLLCIEDFIPPAPPPPHPAPTYDVEKDRSVQRLFQQALRELAENGLPVDISAIGTRMRKLQKSFDLKRTRFKRLTDLAIFLEHEGVVRLGTNAQGARQIEIVADSKVENEKPAAGAAVTTKKVGHESHGAILPNGKKKPKVSRKKAKVADSPSLFGEE